MDLDTSDKDGFPPPPVNIFKGANWRAISIVRLLIYVSLYFTPLYYIYIILYYTVLVLYVLAVRFKHWLTKTTPRLRSPYRVRARYFIFLGAYYLVKLWPNQYTFLGWWLAYAYLEDAESFHNTYSNSWSEKLGPNCFSLHIFVEGNYFLAQLPLIARPSAFHQVNANVDEVYDADNPVIGGDDDETLEFLRMWYCDNQLQRGLGELLLTKKLIRIDIVKVNYMNGTKYSGDRIGTWDLGRKGHSQVAFFEDNWKVRGQSKLTKELFNIDKNELGLMFVRTWNVPVISAIILFPFVLSLVFAGVWIGVYVARGADVQIAVQTAFTVSSYIVTSGALLVALVAFVDAQHPKEN